MLVYFFKFDVMFMINFDYLSFLLIELCIVSFIWEIERRHEAYRGERGPSAWWRRWYKKEKDRVANQKEDERKKKRNEKDWKERRNRS